MPRFLLSLPMVIACAAGLSAQSATVKSETKVEVKEGKDVTVTGCLARSANGVAFQLNDVEGKGVTSRAYTLVGKDDLASNIGQLVEIKGKASDLGGDAKVEVKTKSKIEREGADDKKTTSETTLKGDLPGIPFLGVKSVKVLRDSCS